MHACQLVPVSGVTVGERRRVWSCRRRKRERAREREREREGGREREREREIGSVRRGFGGKKQGHVCGQAVGMRQTCPLACVPAGHRLRPSNA